MSDSENKIGLPGAIAGIGIGKVLYDIHSEANEKSMERAFSKALEKFEKRKEQVEASNINEEVKPRKLIDDFFSSAAERDFDDDELSVDKDSAHAFFLKFTQEIFDEEIHKRIITLKKTKRNKESLFDIGEHKGYFKSIDLKGKKTDIPMKEYFKDMFTFLMDMFIFYTELMDEIDEYTEQKLYNICFNELEQIEDSLARFDSDFIIEPTIFDENDYVFSEEECEAFHSNDEMVDFIENYLYATEILLNGLTVPKHPKEKKAEFKSSDYYQLNEKINGKLAAKFVDFIDLLAGESLRYDFYENWKVLNDVDVSSDVDTWNSTNKYEERLYRKLAIDIP